jgi:glutathione S-transferase
MVLEEKGLPYSVHEEDLSHPSADLLSMHPEGRVPLLVHEWGEQRRILFQSTVITEYLEEQFPQVALMPKDPMERAEVRLWTYWCDSIFKLDLDLYKYELRGLSEDDAKALHERLESHFTRWEGAFQRGGPYLLGRQMTLADIHLFPFARQFMAAKPQLPEIEKFEKFQSWLQLMVSRPAFDRVMQKKGE